MAYFAFKSAEVDILSDDVAPIVTLCRIPAIALSVEDAFISWALAMVNGPSLPIEEVQAVGEGQSEKSPRWCSKRPATNRRRLQPLGVSYK